MYQEYLNQASQFAEDFAGEPTTIKGLGTFIGIVDQSTREKDIRKGLYNSEVSGQSIITYRKILFTDAQLKTLESASIVIPSLSPNPLPVTQVDRDLEWITVYVDSR